MEVNRSPRTVIFEEADAFAPQARPSESRRGIYIKPHMIAKRAGSRSSSERFREAIDRLKQMGLIEEGGRG